MMGAPPAMGVTAVTGGIPVTWKIHEAQTSPPAGVPPAPIATSATGAPSATRIRPVIAATSRPTGRQPTGRQPTGRRATGRRATTGPKTPSSAANSTTPTTPVTLTIPAAVTRAERGYPQDGPEPEPGAYRGRRRGKASGAPDAPGPGRGRRDDHVAHHAEGPPWDEAYPDDGYEDDRFVPGLGGPRRP